MSGNIEFVPLGGTVDITGHRPGIGGSAYALIDKDSSSAVLVDCGAYPHSHEGRERETEIALGFDEFENMTFSKVGSVFIPDMPEFCSNTLSGVVDVNLADLSELNMPGFEPLEGGPALRQEPPSVEEMEWEHIQRVLNEHEGNISATARALNMHRRTLQRKLQKHSRWRQ